MIALTREDDTLTLVSDDRYGENAAIEDALKAAAPELLEAYMSTPVSPDGVLRFNVERADWRGLLDAIEELGSKSGAVDPDELMGVERLAAMAVEEL